MGQKYFMKKQLFSLGKLGMNTSMNSKIQMIQHHLDFFVHIKG
ncbi:hypothetical protein SAMN05216179_0091 [Gracilibacillus kekensis]|uniref:Uncharacterized protein n=1 Tax=Gracilibacillus kekensis TaxID=1027249 RepID=A0A1M7ILB1_9BACI|nr:hypothetical protein SAMN05216179_0091 [Gracilibacillus kekensis]